jgi:O-antigen ligase
LTANVQVNNRRFGIGFLIFGTILLAILASWQGSLFGIAIIGIVLFIVYFIYSIVRPEIVVYFAIFISGLSGSLSIIRYELLPVSLSGLLTFLLLVSTLFAILSRLKYQSTLVAIKAYMNFYPLLIMLIAGSIFGPHFVDGLRLSLLMTTPILVGILARREMVRSPEIRQRIEKALIFIPVLPISIILINLIAGTLQSTARGFQTSFGLGYSPRTLALFLLPILALFVAKWRYSKNYRRRIAFFLGSITLTAIIITSLSRVASVIALVVILPSRFIKKWYYPSTIFTFLFGLGLLLYWLSIPSVQARFFPSGIDNIKLNFEAFQSIDTQGRVNLWTVTWQNALGKPILGHGTGSAGHLIYSTYPPLEHPHNDYLRVFHDTGIVGLFFFVMAWVLQLIHYWKNWKYADRRGLQHAMYNLAAFTATLAICISFLTDNTMTYVFVLIPLFIIYGLADSPTMEKAMIESS